MMRKPSNLPLQIWLPAVVFSILLALLWVVAWTETVYRDRAHLEKSIEFLTHDMNLLTKQIEEEFEGNDLGKAESALTTRGVNLNYTNLIAVDDQRQVLMSKRLSWKGADATAVMPGFDSQAFDKATNSHAPAIEVDQKQRKLLAYFPFGLSRRQTELRSSRVGALVLEYELGPKPRIVSALLSNKMVLSALIAAMAILIWALNTYINRPIRNLVELTQRFANAEDESDPEVVQEKPKRTIGEIATLGSSLTNLANSVEQRVKELQTLYSLANAIRATSSLPDLFSKAVRFIPGGMRNTRLVRARIIIDGKAYVHHDFEVDQVPLSAPITTGAKARGSVEVHFLRKAKRKGEQPFTKEEGKLLNEIAHALSEAISRNEMEASKASAESQLRQVQKMEAIGQLTGGIAHDFNNLLGIVLGNIELMEAEIGTEGPAAKRLQAISKSSERAAELTGKLLQFSRRGSSQQNPTDANQLITDLSTLVQRTLTPAVSIDLDFDDDLWLALLDPGDLEDSLLNLAVNARDAMPQGGTITIQTSNLFVRSHDRRHNNLKPGEYVCISVTDTGTGIPETLIDRVMEPFFSTKPTGQGTGLGLAMVYGFVKRSNGRIDLQTKPGVGTTVKMTFPRSLEAPTRGEQDQVQDAEPPHGDETVLVVDDEEQLLAVERAILESLGYSIITANNPKDALRILAHDPTIQLLLSDVVMPGGITGYDLAEQARINHPELPIVMTSGYSDSEACHKRSKVMRLETLAKPFTSKELGLRVRNALDQKPADFGPKLPGSVGTEFDELVALEWEPAYSVGVEAVDRDHQNLLKMVLASRETLDSNPNKLTEMLSQLAADCERHFELEEQLMEKCGYPALAHHRKLHGELSRLLKEKLKGWQEGSANADELRGLLGGWWQDHIRIADGAFAPYCESQTGQDIAVLNQANHQ
jgi:hemerythrin-like metal-binding protein